MELIHLQGIGKHRAKFARDLVVGDTIVYNYGETGKVVSVHQKGKSVYYDVVEKGNVYHVRKNKSTLVGVKGA